MLWSRLMADGPSPSLALNPVELLDNGTLYRIKQCPHIRTHALCLVISIWVRKVAGLVIWVSKCLASGYWVRAWEGSLEL